MKRIVTLIFIVFSLFRLDAQKHELGVFFGVTNGITDIGRTDYVNPLPKDSEVGVPTIPINLGLLYKYNLNPHHSLRFNLHYTRFVDNDGLAAEDYRFERYIKYSQILYESSLFFEYNFFPINSEQRNAHSPYIFAGLGAFAYNHPTYKVVNKIDAKSEVGFSPLISKNNELKFSYTLPFGAGYKYKFSYNWEAGLEIGARPTIIDDLDMANAKKEDFEFYNEVGLLDAGVDRNEIYNSNDELVKERQVGDRSNNDWYVFTGLTLTYSFGRPPCFCD